MSRQFVRVKELLSAEEKNMNFAEHDWVLVQREGKTLYLLRAEDLETELQSSPSDSDINLADLDLRRWSTASVRSASTLREALDTLSNKAVEAVLVMDFSRREGRIVRGVLTRDNIERHFLMKLSYP